jgi:hypothetical protein
VRRLGREPTAFGTSVGAVLDHFGVEAGAESMSGWHWPQTRPEILLGGEAIMMRGKRSPRVPQKNTTRGRDCSEAEGPD